MIKIRLLKAALMLCSLLISSAASAETINDKLSLQFSDLMAAPIEVDGMNYAKLIVNKLQYTTGSVGEAELPCDIRSYLVPENHCHFEVTITKCDSLVYPLLYPPYIIQEPQTSNDYIANRAVSLGNYTYNSPRFPTTPVEIINDGYLFGNNHIIDVRVTPFIYEVKTNRLLILTNIEYTITTSSMSAFSLKKNTYTSFLRPVENLVESAIIQKDVINPINYEDLVSLMPPVSLSDIPLVGNSNLPAYQYMVVTNRELAPAFDKIIGLKKQKGYKAGVVCIEDILADTKYANGDTISGIKDDAGKLRAFLCDAYKTGSTQYVLLGGGKDIVPIRYAACWPKYYQKWDKTNKLTPTDLYFSDLNGNWDYNKNGLYAVYNSDKVDFYPELFIGRILCTNKEEIENYTYKLLKYELNPGNGDFSYLRKAFFFQSDGGQDYKQAQDIIDIAGNLFDDANYFEENPSFDSPEPTFPTGNDVINELNNIHYGYIGPHGHGNPFAITTKSNGDSEDIFYGIVSLQCIPKSKSNREYEDSHGLDMLKNNDYPAILYTPSCTVSPFDTYNGYSGYYNIGESFTIGGNYGGPIFIGNTRDGYMLYSWLLERVFIKSIKSIPQVGMTQALSKVQWKDTGSYQHHCRLTSNLLGCPELPMWTKTPQYINCTGDDSSSTTKNITIGNSGARISKIQLSTGSVTVTDSVIPNETVQINTINKVISVSGENLITKFFDLKLKMISSIADGYYFVNNLTIGDKNMRIDIVKFKNCKVSFNEAKNVDIYSSFVADEGSDLTIISKRTVNVYGGNIKAGAKVKIIAPEVIFHNKFDCAKGADLTIMNKKQSYF